MRPVFTCSAILLSCAAGLAKARIETADARTLSGELLAIAGGQVVIQGEKAKQTLDLKNVVEISLALPPDAMATSGQRMLVTVAGDRVAVTDVAFDGAALRASSSLLGDVSLKLEAARGVYLPDVNRSPRDVEDLVAKMKLPDATADRLIVARKAKQPLAVDGVLEAIGPERVTFRWKDRSRKLPRSTVLLVRLAAVRAAGTPRKGLLLGRDGSTLGFTDLTLEKGSVQLVSPAFGRQAVPIDRVAAIRYAWDNVVSLADLKPDAVKEHGFFETTFRHRANRSVAGKPLRLGGRTYRAGLGLHSYCELLYQLDGKYSAFVATVGIDDAVRPNGDATVHFVADGRPLTRPIRVTGKTPPQPVRLTLDGVAALLIRVDFGGDGLGLADHVDLAGARLIRK